MGRRPYKNLNLPQRMRARVKSSGKTFYYYDTGKRPRCEIPLGSDYALAVKKWAELEIDAKPRHREIITFRYISERYLRDVVPTKAQATQRDNLREIAQLYKFFDNPPAPLEQIQPVHIRQYLDWRKHAPVRANREKALFSHIWNKAREWGYTDKPNPCQGIHGHKERGRDIYVEDHEYEALWSAADEALRDALDLAYLTGQRPADTLNMTEVDIREDVLHVRQSKRGKKLRIAISGQLSTVINRILERKRTYKVRNLALVCKEDGQPLTYYALRHRFDKAREKAGVNFQFRDLRAKAGTDKAESQDIHAAQKQLGHKTIIMTEHYVRERLGDKVDPTK